MKLLYSFLDLGNDFYSIPVGISDAVSEQEQMLLAELHDLWLGNLDDREREIVRAGGLVYNKRFLPLFDHKSPLIFFVFTDGNKMVMVTRL